MTVRHAFFIGIGIALIAFGAYMLLNPEALSREEAPHAYVLEELGVELTLPEELEDLTYEARPKEPAGMALFMLAEDVPDIETGKGCELGVLYLVPKDRVMASGWTEARLVVALAGQEGAPPSAKEFPDSYLVFEPSQAVCTNDPDKVGIEAGKRIALWEAIATAKETAE